MSDADDESIALISIHDHVESGPNHDHDHDHDHDDHDDHDNRDRYLNHEHGENLSSRPLGTLPPHPLISTSSAGLARSLPTLSSRPLPTLSSRPPSLARYAHSQPSRLDLSPPPATHRRSSTHLAAADSLHPTRSLQLTSSTSSAPPRIAARSLSSPPSTHCTAHETTLA
ncbi:hypothetical protein BDY19DRAFT_998785 [Irpex rosettiformis]|uniref:Uncharacterized protein n=1 Tax=Irpex rosettiformis TaxID=378272 RepID=A0ACB8TMD2_9APHY|nr:hypothetical protein BDY19DRAFT_998785 [Irpex rosettiformis]